MIKAEWNGATIAQSETTVIVEGNHYFPPESVNHACLEPSATSSVCPWKGTAGYYSIVVDGRKNEDAAWYYAEPFEKARAIKNHVAFWRGVTITSG